MKNKLISLALVGTLCVGMIAGCGSKSSDTGASESTKASETTKTSEATVSSESVGEETEEVVNISVRMYSVNDQPAEKAVIDAMNAYSAEKIGVTISFQGVAANEYRDKVSMSLASKEDIDLVWTATSYGEPGWTKDGALMEITDLVKEYEGLYNVMPEEIWKSVEREGKLYYIPNYKETGTGFSIATPVAVADEIKEKYGIDFNELEISSFRDYANLEEYLLAAIEIGVDMPIPTGMNFNCAIKADPVFEIITGPFVLNKETGEVSIYYELPEFREFVELMIEWNEKGIWKEEQVMSDFSYADYVKSGSYALMGWTTVPDNVNNCTDRYGVPVYVKEVTENYIQSDSAMGSGWAITAYSEKADACLKWLELINTDTEFADLWVYGIEGTNYTREADGSVAKIADSGWSNGSWKATNAWVLSLMSSEAADKKEQYTVFNESAIPSAVLGFRADTEKVSTEVAAVAAIHSELGNMMQFGFHDIEKMDEVAANCKAAGSDAVIAEFQAQLDAFLANK